MENVNGIKSKERVQQYGEVFTPDSIVMKMIEMVDEPLLKECNTVDEYLDKTWLEPACGDGQFLIRILYRKLEEVNKLEESKRQLAIVKSLCTIYGVDIQNDNVEQSRERMFKLLCGEPVETFDINNSKYNIQIDTGVKIEGKLRDVVKHILDTNIICGNTLKKDELHITEWKFKGEEVESNLVTLAHLEWPVVQYKTVHYLDLPNRKGEDESDELDDYDF